VTSKAGIETHNPDPGEPLPTGAPRDALLADFGARLQRAMREKGWTQSDLARQATMHTAGRTRVRRDAVSLYVRGLSFPRPAALSAMAGALGCGVEDLRPKGVPSAVNALELKSTGDGMAWLRVNQAVPMDIALKVTSLLNQPIDA